MTHSFTSSAPVEPVESVESEPVESVDKSVVRPRKWMFLTRLLRETRTRILFLYSLLLVSTAGLSIPIFVYVLFANVDRRVREDLIEERDSFLVAYEAWERQPDQTIEDLKAFVDRHFSEARLEDDNSQILLIDDQFYRSSPTSLIPYLQPGSELFKKWQNVHQYTIDEFKTGEAETGSILYTTDPLLLEGRQRGTLVTTHVSAGERQEALVGVYLLVQILSVAFVASLLLAWAATGQIMSPIASLSKTARSISESDLTQRIVKPHSEGELAELVDTFNEMMDRIQAAFDSQRDFINDAGHELRTPITIIQGHLELLDDDPKEQQETMELVMDELDRMGRLVSDLLLLAKSERPHFLQLEQIDTTSFTEALYAKATALTDRNWLLTIEGQATLTGDRQKLTGAILNLIRNATQYTQTNDIIELGCRVTKDYADHPNGKRQVQFWVRDTGEGITPAEQERIFARFARGGQRRSDGSGLGLAITRAIAEAHNGNLNLTSQPKKGSTFRITLPIASPVVSTYP